MSDFRTPNATHQKHTRTIDLFTRVNVDEALRYLGYRDQALSNDIRRRLARAVEVCETEMKPRGMYRTYPIVKRQANEIQLGGTSFVLEGHDIVRHLEGCEDAVLLCVTLGSESEMALRREAACSDVDGVLVDACASSLVEQAAHKLSSLIAKEAAEHDQAITERFSPGYGDFPVACQRQFLGAIGTGNVLGIQVTSSQMLVPMKSITAVVGLLPAHKYQDSSRALTLDDIRKEGVEDPARRLLLCDGNCARCTISATCRYAPLASS